MAARIALANIEFVPRDTFPPFISLHFRESRDKDSESPLYAEPLDLSIRESRNLKSKIQISGLNFPIYFSNSFAHTYILVTGNNGEANLPK